MAAATLPPPVDIDNDTKKAIIDGLKRVMSVFQEGGCLEPSVTYQRLTSDPEALLGFIQTFLQHRDRVDEIVRPKGGKAPVRDEDTPLQCGVSLNQIQQLLVRTCAKKVFEQTKPMETVTETVTKKSFLFFTKTEQVEVQRQSADPAEERKVREIARYVAYGWQLPLLHAYRQHLTFPQIIEIGDSLLALTSAESVAAVGVFDAAVLKKVKAATGADFNDILATKPQAIGGIATWNRDMYEFYRKMLGESAWAFFAREKEFFNVVVSLDKPTAKIFGDVLCYIASDNLQEMARLNIDKTEVLVSALKTAFTDKLPVILAVPAFSKDILRKVVDNLLHMNQDKEKLMLSFSLSCKALVPSVMEWLAKQ